MNPDEMILKLEEYSHEVMGAFGGLSKESFNWKPAIEGAAEGEHNSSIRERMPGLPSITGKLVLKAVDPDNVKKSKAPKILFLLKAKSKPVYSKIIYKHRSV